MKRRFFLSLIGAATLLIFSTSFFHVAAQPRGGAGLRPGGGKANFGGGSVVHRNFTPPANMPRPNLKPSPASDGRPSFQPGNRPNLPDVPKRTVPRPSKEVPGGRDLIPGDLKPSRPEGGGGAVGRKPGDRPTAGHSDGPDWKRWNNIDKSKIHDSVVNRPAVDRATADRVREHFDERFSDKKFFSEDWFAKHPDGWRPPHPGPHPGRRPLPPPPPRFWWNHPHWDHAWGWFAAGFFTGLVTDAILEPIVYDYGSNIVYQNEMVYINNVPYVDADAYYQQAQDLARTGEGEKASEDASTETVAETVAETASEPTATQAEGTSGDWLSMGTFAIIADGAEKTSERFLQLATNKEGRIRGNLVDPKNDESAALYGSVDPKTQRVAFMISGNDDCVAECGLWNLTQDTVPLLVHVDKDRTEERTLVRLGDAETKKE